MKVKEKWSMNNLLFYKIRYCIANSSGFTEVVSLLNNLICGCLRLYTGRLCMRRNLLTMFAYNYMKNWIKDRNPSICKKASYIYFMKLYRLNLFLYIYYLLRQQEVARLPCSAIRCFAQLWWLQGGREGTGHQKGAGGARGGQVRAHEECARARRHPHACWARSHCATSHGTGESASRHRSLSFPVACF